MQSISKFFLYKMIGSLAFSKALFRAPFSMGMICPSSPFLTKKLANQIPKSTIVKLQQQNQMVNAGEIDDEKQAFVVELGAGTGAVTKAILNRGVPPSHLLVFEKNKTMAGLLKQRFPGIRIIQDDAANMKDYLPKNAYIAAIISSLPFVSLPKNVSDNIIFAIKNVLEDNLLIQYTYALNQKTLLEERGFIVNKKHTVWLNLPPAHVMCYTFSASVD